MAVDSMLPDLADARVAAAIHLVWHEAWLLDRGLYERWDDLWTPDSRYVIPIDPDTGDFASCLNLVYDDTRMRRKRIERLTSGYSISALAAARTVRTVSRFTVTPAGDGTDRDTIELNSAQVLVGHKREHTFVLGADLLHRIRLTPEGPRIALKVVRLLNSRESVSASGFLL